MSYRMLLMMWLKVNTPPRVRFKRPFVFSMEAPGLAGQVLTVKQAPFSHEGFASTGETFNKNAWVRHLRKALCCCFGEYSSAVKLIETSDCGVCAPTFRGGSAKVSDRRWSAPYTEDMQRCAVWDSSIVMARYFEMREADIKGKRCLDLSAGCGLVGMSPGFQMTAQ